MVIRVNKEYSITKTCTDKREKKNFNKYRKIVKQCDEKERT